MKLVCSILLCCCAVSASGFSMSMRDVGITSDIRSVASSLNDIFKESFELMIGSLGKHGVYYLAELRREFSFGKPGEEMKFDFHASNGWLKNPTMKAAEGMDSGALRKYKVPLAANMRETLLVCVECLEISAETVNFCYEANFNGKNVSGTITSGPILYALSLEVRITQTLNVRENEDTPMCKVTLGERSFELSERSKLAAEVRGLRSFNFAADPIDTWLREHLNTTVRAQLQKRLLTSLDKVVARHDVCQEFIGDNVERLNAIK
uniref:Lipid-binding serum glycoprotein N-terminal domain-containing protein n=1 Tax=Graphocephala atropunctata TaxID=36148 RepID=A0A1B6KRK9_9HEMI